MATLVLTVIGDDRSGLVDSLAEVVAAHGGNWTKSHMAQLGGKFAGIVMVTIPDNSAPTFQTALDPLTSQGLLDITVATSVDDTNLLSDATGQSFALSLLGPDQSGIVHDLSGALAERGVSIAELRTQLREAPMAGGMLFEAHATLVAPADLSSTELQECIEALEAELMVDIELHAGGTDRSTPGA